MRDESKARGENPYENMKCGQKLGDQFTGSRMAE